MHCWWTCKPVQPLWEMVWRFLKKLRIKLPHDPATSKNVKAFICKDICTEVLFTVAKAWEQQKCPLLNDWIKKMW